MLNIKKSDVGSDPLISMAGSDLDEVLNWSSLRANTIAWSFGRK